MKHLILCIFAVCFGCSTNIYEPLASADSDKSLLEEAAYLIDKQDYVKANETLAKINSDSNDKRILQVASSLGASGFNMWEIILDVLDNKSGNQQIGFDNLFDALSSTVFGTDERQERVESLSQSIQLLLAAPNPEESDLKNLNCFLGGILSLAAVDDATNGITAVQSNLDDIQNNAVNGGATSNDCPGVTELQTNLETISAAQTNLSLVLQATQDCAFIDTQSGSLNSVEQSLQNFTNNGDQGCSENPDCGNSLACQALQFSCVKDQVNDSTSEAGDGQVSSCEMVQNCLGSSCF